MREIKFRGIVASIVNIEKSDKETEWVYGNYFGADDDITGTIINDYAQYEVLTDSIGQYTGLKDKNGTEIYEGDIVKIFARGNKYHVGTIEYIKGGFIINTHDDCFYIMDGVEVVGNKLNKE